MGHKNQEKAQSQVAYSTALTTAKEETPYERKRREFNEGIVDYAAKGDYHTPPAAGKVFYNFADPAQQKANRALLDNTRGQGVSALGAGANPELLALNKQHMDDVAERDAAQNYQDTTAKLVSGAYSDLGDMQQAADAKNLNILGTTAGQYSQQSQLGARPKWWQTLLGGGQAAATTGLKDGGRVDPYIGKRVLVGEAGKEALVNDDGTTKLLGVDGPQVITPQQPGTVIPNKQLPDFLRFTRTPVGDAGGALPASRPRTVNAPAPPLPAAPSAEVAPAAKVPAVTHLLNQPIETQPVALRDAIVPHAIEPLPPTFAESAGVDESGATQTRPRFADPAGHLERQIAYEGEHPAQDHNGRLKSTLKGIAVNAAQGFVQGGLPGAVRGGIVGGAVGALHPAVDEERNQEGRVYKWQQTLADLRANEKRKLDLAEQRAGTRVKDAQAKYYEARPDLKAAKQEANGLRLEQNAVMANLRMLKGQRIDPNNTQHAKLLQRAADAGVDVDPDAWNEAVTAGRAVSFDMVDPANPTTKQRVTLDKGTGHVSPLLVDDKPAVTGYVAPVHPVTEMTTMQEDASHDRKAGQAEQHRHNVESEQQGQTRIGQGDERIGIARENQTLRGQPTPANTNARLARAAELNRKLEEEKNAASHPPRSVKGADGTWQPTDETYRAGYTARHKQAAAGYMQQIQAGHGDLSRDRRVDPDGWPYAKPKTAPVTGPPRAAAGGAMYSEADVRARARAAGRDENAAVEAARKGGLIRQ